MSYDREIERITPSPLEELKRSSKEQEKRSKSLWDSKFRNLAVSVAASHFYAATPENHSDVESLFKNRNLKPYRWMLDEAQKIPKKFFPEEREQLFRQRLQEKFLEKYD